MDSSAVSSMSGVTDEKEEGKEDVQKSLKHAGLPERFGNRDSMEPGPFYRRRTSTYDDGDIPTSKYDLMTAAERKQEEARIEGGIKQV